MKRILFLLAILFASCSNNKTTDLNVYQLEGNVASLKVSSYKAVSKFGEIVKGELDNSELELIIIEFNELGNVASYSYYDESGGLEFKEIYSYNNDKLDNIALYESDGRLFRKTFLTWDNDCLLKDIAYFYYSDGQEEAFRNLYEYENNKMKSVISYNYGEFEFKNIYEYNDDGLLTGIISYDKDGAETSNISYVLKRKQIVKYERVHNNRHSLVLYEDKLPIKSENCYQIMNTINTINSENVIYYYEYEFDNKGNWIKCTTYKGEAKQPYQIIEREITYK